MRGGEQEVIKAVAFPRQDVCYCYCENVNWNCACNHRERGNISILRNPSQLLASRAIIPRKPCPTLNVSVEILIHPGHD